MALDLIKNLSKNYNFGMHDTEIALTVIMSKTNYDLDICGDILAGIMYKCNPKNGIQEFNNKIEQVLDDLKDDNSDFHPPVIVKMIFENDIRRIPVVSVENLYEYVEQFFKVEISSINFYKSKPRNKESGSSWDKSDYNVLAKIDLNRELRDLVDQSKALYLILERK